LLQKAYPVSNFIAAGFAGSVRIGFKLLQSLNDFLVMHSETQEKMAWDPIWVSNNWASTAKTEFEQEPATEKSLGSQFLIVGVSPQEDSGLGAKTYFTKFSAPHFQPGIMSRPIKFCSIGSGAGIDEYKRIMKPLFRLSSGILQAEVGHKGGWARQLGFSISRALADHPRRGISRHIHIIIVTRDEIYVESNDENIYVGDSPPIKIRMPPVAQGYDHFLKLAQSAGHDITGATC